jgi:hypothetical protein
MRVNGALNIDHEFRASSTPKQQAAAPVGADGLAGSYDGFLPSGLQQWRPTSANRLKRCDYSDPDS